MNSEVMAHSPLAATAGYPAAADGTDERVRAAQGEPLPAAEGEWFAESSPLLQEYRLGERAISSNPASESFVELVHQLHDDGLDDVMYELASEAAEVARRFESNEAGGRALTPQEAERRLDEHFAPLREELDAFFLGVERETDSRDLEAMTEAAFDELLESFAPQTGHLQPSFEGFFKKLWKKAKKVAKKAWKKAKKVAKRVGRLALGPLYGKLRRAAKSLLKRVLKFALSKIPKRYRPAAKKVAKHFGILHEVSANDGASEPQEGFLDLQVEFDTVLAGIALADDEVVQEEALTEFESPVGSGSEVDLAAAREKFVRQLQELEEGEDPEPYIEEFAQAVLMAVRLGIKLIGRKRVVSFLAKYLARLIRRWVGRQAAKPLSRAIVDAGLKLLSLEVDAQDEQQAATYALAGLVEDTVRAVAELPDPVLADETEMAEHVGEAMERAAAANLPQLLPERVYRSRPDLRESSRVRGTWVGLPLRRRRRYKKHTWMPDRVRITPHVSREVEVFGGRRLDEFLRTHAGVDPGGEVLATAHLYETLAGSDVSDIVQNEAHVIGLGADAGAWSRLLPLTPAAAGMLFGEPGIGSHYTEEQLVDPRQVGPGSRLYFLEIPGAYGKTSRGTDGERLPPQDSEVTTTVDLPRGQVRVGLYLSEPEAQELLQGLRGRMRGLRAAAHHRLRRILRQRLKRLKGARMRVVDAVSLPQSVTRRLLSKLPLDAEQGFVEHLEHWTGAALARGMGAHAEELAAALESEADGVTVTARLEGVPGLEQLAASLQGAGPPWEGEWFEGPQPRASFSFRPGKGGDEG